MASSGTCNACRLLADIHREGRHCTAHRPDGRRAGVHGPRRCCRERPLRRLFMIAPSFLPTGALLTWLQLDLYVLLPRMRSGFLGQSLTKRHKFVNLTIPTTVDDQSPFVRATTSSLSRQSDLMGHHHFRTKVRGLWLRAFSSS